MRPIILLLTILQPGTLFLFATETINVVPFFKERIENIVSPNIDQQIEHFARQNMVSQKPKMCSPASPKWKITRYNYPADSPLGYLEVWLEVTERLEQAWVGNVRALVVHHEIASFDKKSGRVTRKYKLLATCIREQHVEIYIKLQGSKRQRIDLLVNRQPATIDRAIEYFANLEE